MRKFTQEECSILWSEYNQTQLGTYCSSDYDLFSINFDRWLICMGDEAVDRILREHNNPYAGEYAVQYEGE